jgi:hypothetical protein
MRAGQMFKFQAEYSKNQVKPGLLYLIARTSDQERGTALTGI